MANIGDINGDGFDGIVNAIIIIMCIGFKQYQLRQQLIDSDCV